MKPYSIQTPKEKIITQLNNLSLNEKLSYAGERTLQIIREQLNLLDDHEKN